jgi:hypothetical protein
MAGTVGGAGVTEIVGTYGIGAGGGAGGGAGVADSDRGPGRDGEAGCSVDGGDAGLVIGGAGAGEVVDADAGTDADAAVGAGADAGGAGIDRTTGTVTRGAGDWGGGVMSCRDASKKMSTTVPTHATAFRWARAQANSRAAVCRDSKTGGDIGIGGWLAVWGACAGADADTDGWGAAEAPNITAPLCSISHHGQLDVPL